MKTTNNKQTGNSYLANTFMTGALLALLTLPVQSMADEQMQFASPEKAVNSYTTYSDIAENYGDINDEEDDYVTNTDDAKSDVMSSRSTTTQILLASNTSFDDSEESAYADNQDDG